MFTPHTLSRWEKETPTAIGGDMRFLVLIITCIFVASLLLTACGEEELSEPSGASGEDRKAPLAVYLHGSEDVTLNSVFLLEHDIQTVTTVDDFVASVQELRPISIWIDAAHLSGVSPVWLQHQVRSGMIVVGINVSGIELAEQMRVFLEKDAERSDWNPDDVPTFVGYYEVSYEFTNQSGEPALGFSSGWRQDEFNPQHPGIIVGFVERASEIITSRQDYTEPLAPTPEASSSTFSISES